MYTSTSRVLLLVATLLFTVQSARESNAQVAQEKRNPALYYTLLTQGMLSGPIFPYTFTTGNFRVEARNLIMGHAKASEVPTPADVVMELRGGAVTTTINGQRHEQTEGDFWIVQKGSRLDVENKGQVAVIRAISVYQGAK